MGVSISLGGTRSNRPLVPSMTRIALLALAIGAASANLGTIQRISTLTSICEDCDMTLFGTINVKVCGGGGGVGGYEPCCSVVNIANFDSGLFQQGQLDDFTGQELEDCNNYSLSQLSNPSDLDVTVYHEGSDGAQLDWIEISTNTMTVQCTLGMFMDGFSNQKGLCQLN